MNQGTPENLGKRLESRAIDWWLLKDRVLEDNRVSVSEIRQVFAHCDQWAVGDGRDGISVSCGITILTGSDGIMSPGSIRRIDEARGRIAAMELDRHGPDAA